MADEASKASLDRRARSIRRLQREGVPVNESLPCVEGELLDLADLMYRYHWAVRDAQLWGHPPPAALNADVVMEWDHALRWIVGYCEQDWDEVSCDT